MDSKGTTVEIRVLTFANGGTIAAGCPTQIIITDESGTVHTLNSYVSKTATESRYDIKENEDSSITKYESVIVFSEKPT